jgi:uncharacterized YkwD family protein
VSFQLRGQRPGYLTSILLLTLCLTLGFAGTALGADNAVAMTSEEAQVVELINQARCDAGLAPLKVEPKLSALARIKAQDMASNRYLSHTSPTYGTQREMMQAAAMGFVYAGENIAKAPTISSGCKALYYSGAARAKLLSTNYDQLGVGIAPCGSYKIIVQMFAGGMQATVSNPPKEAAPAAPAPAPAEPSDGLNADEQAMLNLVNQERVKAGLNPLQSDPTLVKLARMKAQDMIDKGYFSHTSPTYGSPFDLLRANGVTYSYAGENLAGAGSTSSAHTNLMNSAGHRANILNGNYTKVGIGVVSGGPYGKMFVQLFIKPAGNSQVTAAKPVPEQPAPPVTNPTVPAPAAPAPAPAEPANGLNADEQAMLNLVNQERVKAGLKPLQSDPTLVKLARMKAQDMIDKGYFSHTSPTYGSPFDLMRANGVTYSYAGENLAGAGSTSSAHTNLMNSAGHRAIILKGNYTKVGIGVVSGGPYGKMFVQLFIG